jgi:hypothetical protein
MAESFFGFLFGKIVYNETGFRRPLVALGIGGAMLVRRNLMSSAKQDVESLLHKLPDNSSVEDIQYHLYVLDKVRRGLEDARANGTLSQQDVETRLSKWLTE